MLNKNRNEDDSYKTGCIGVLVPLVVAAYGIRTIVRQRTTGRWGRSPTVGPEAVEFGIAVIAVALFAHAWGFEPYRRHPFVRWLLTALSIALFLKGVIRGL